MTGYEWQRIAQAKMFSQRQKCGVCGRPLDLYKYPRPQLAHRVPNTKANREKYGKAIDHPKNLVLVCAITFAGKNCNDAVLLGAGHPVAAEELMNEIKEAMNENET